MQITLDQLKQITNQKESVLTPFIDFLNKTCVQFVINSNLNISHFIAQISHESAGFLYTSEIASGKEYEGRTDLGNSTSGFGVLYKGSGLIQLTGFFNYKKISDYFNVDFVSQPKLLQTPEWACKSAGWYWSSKKLSDLAEQNDFLNVTFRVNGGHRGLQSRLKYLKLCFKAFQVPNYEILLKDIFAKIEQNINLPQTNTFKNSLSKAVPNLQVLTDLKNFINLV